MLLQQRTENGQGRSRNEEQGTRNKEQGTENGKRKAGNGGTGPKLQRNPLITMGSKGSEHQI